MFKEIIKCLKDYETLEYNSKRLNKGFKKDCLVFTKLYNTLYNDGVLYEI